MFFRKNGYSTILFIRGFVDSDGDLSVNNIHEFAREEAHKFCSGLYHEAKDIERMRAVVEYYSDLYNRKRYAALKREISEAGRAMTWYIALPNLSLASTDKRVLATYECGFIYKMRHEMESIEMFANAGLSKEAIVRKMNYRKDSGVFDEEEDESEDPLIRAEDESETQEYDSEEAGETMSESIHGT